MSAIRLTAETRDGTGKGAARKIRRGGNTPAILYGKGFQNLHLKLNTGELKYLLAWERATASGVLELEFHDGKERSLKNILIKEIQRHPFRDEILHVDLLEVAMDKEVSVMVPVEVVGESVGVKMGGILELKRRELEIRCLPGNIPDAITVDVTELDIGDALHVESIHPPEGVAIQHDVNFTILTVVGAAPEEEEIVEVEEPETEAEAAEPEVIGKGREEKAAPEE